VEDLQSTKGEDLQFFLQECPLSELKDVEGLAKGKELPPKIFYNNLLADCKPQTHF
jgi:hypothetical protein